MRKVSLGMRWRRDRNGWREVGGEGIGGEDGGGKAIPRETQVLTRNWGSSDARVPENNVLTEARIVTKRPGF